MVAARRTQRKTSMTVGLTLLLVILPALFCMYLVLFKVASDGINKMMTSQQQEADVPHFINYKDTVKEYIPSSCEKYIVEHATELGYASTAVGTAQEPWLNLPNGCTIWNDQKASNEDIYNTLQSYLLDLEKYNEAMENFVPIPDLLDEIKKGNYYVCLSAKVHPDGLLAFFPSKQLSLTKSGYVEPLATPMRTMKFCKSSGVMDMDFLVHDFEAMCRNLKPMSRRVFIDLGALLDHGTGNPVGWLLGEYEKFGFIFDHIYVSAIEFIKPEDVFGHLLAEKYIAAYHWMNVGKYL
jgi:hypothetical protein